MSSTTQRAEDLKTFGNVFARAVRKCKAAITTDAQNKRMKILELAVLTFPFSLSWKSICVPAPSPDYCESVQLAPPAKVTWSPGPGGARIGGHMCAEHLID